MKLSLSLLLLFTLAAFGVHAQDAPPVDVNAVLTTLKTIKQKQQDDTKTSETKLAQQFMSTATDATSAVGYYMDAVRGTQFDGQNHESTEFSDWKKKEDGRLKSPEFRKALCLHLMYISLTLSHDAGAKSKDLIPGLLAYTQQVNAAADDIYGQEDMMRQPLTNSIFVRWLQMGKWVSDDKTWEPVPFNVNGIFEKVILPEFRRTKDVRAISYWDERILREGDRAARTKRTFDMDKFNLSTKPQLLWYRAEEMLTLGLKNRAVNDMVNVIKTYPSNPGIPGWISEVEKLVKPETPVAPPAAAPAPAPSAVAPPVAPVTETIPAAPPADPAAVPDGQPPAQN